MKNILIILVMVGIFGAAVFGQDASDDFTHPIDKKLKECLSKTRATMPRAECYSAANEEWDKDIDTTYTAMIEKLKTFGQREAAKIRLVENSQATWKKFRDAELKLLWDEYGRRKGTIWISTRIIMQIDIAKPRALQLEELWRSIKTYTKV